MVFLNYLPCQLSHQLPLQYPPINCHLYLMWAIFKPRLDTDGNIIIFYVCVCMCLQRRVSACLLVLVGVQPWEANTVGGCDYVTVDCGCHAAGIYNKYKFITNKLNRDSKQDFSSWRLFHNIYIFMLRYFWFHSMITTLVSCHVTHCGILFQGRSWSLWAGGDQALSFGKHVSVIKGAILHWCGGHKTE